MMKNKKSPFKNTEPIRIITKKIKGKKSLKVNGVYFDWNPIYKVYNSRKDYSQLTTKDIKL